MVVRGGWRKRRLGLLLAVFLAACSGRRVIHEVQPGETLFQIGVAYSVPYEEIARANHLRDPGRIRVGQRLVIPGAKKRVEVRAVAPARPTFLPNRADRVSTDPRAQPRNAPRLQWPVSSGAVTSGFGQRGGEYHDGIDISTVTGAPIRAAADGEVVYSASLPGYGNMIVLRHPGGYATIYAHNERHHVRDGERVRRGQLIGTVGRSGRTTGTNLHFEVRKDNVPYNPLHFLPPARQVFGEAGGADGS
jgi:lipoprotein NlpD